MEQSFWITFDNDGSLANFANTFRTAREMAQRRHLTGLPAVTVLAIDIPSIAHGESAALPPLRADLEAPPIPLRPTWLP